MFKQLLKIKMWFHEEYEQCSTYIHSVQKKTNSYVTTIKLLKGKNNNMCIYGYILKKHTNRNS